METRKEYRVVYPFRDLQDVDNNSPNGRVYAIGDIYLAANHSQERIDELAGKSNRMGRPLIKGIDVEVKEEEIEVSLEDLTVKELKDLARGRELEGYSNLTKAELIDLLEGE